MRLLLLLITPESPVIFGDFCHHHQSTFIAAQLPEYDFKLSTFQSQQDRKILDIN